jgi:hypothetical protein
MYDPACNGPVSYAASCTGRSRPADEISATCPLPHHAEASSGGLSKFLVDRSWPISWPERSTTFALSVDLNFSQACVNVNCRRLSGEISTQSHFYGPISIWSPVLPQWRPWPVKLDRSNIFWHFRPPRPWQPECVVSPSLDWPDPLNHAVEKSRRKSEQKHPIQSLQGTHKPPMGS